MIFAFAQVHPKSPGFYMRNTILPLDIIFLSPKKGVLNVQQGKPYDETDLPSAAPFQFVLEMKQGSAKRLGIKPGMAITIPDSVKGK